VSHGVTDFKIVVYIREPVSAYKSFLQQWLRMSDDLEPYDPFAWSYDIRSNILAWESVFGTDSLIVRPFQRENLLGKSVVSDFYHVLSDIFSVRVSCNDDDQSVPEDNESLSIEALSLIQELLSSVSPEKRLDSAWTSSTAKFLRLLRAQQKHILATPVHIKPWVSQLIWTRHADDIEWLSRVYGTQFSPPPVGDTLPPEISSAHHLSFGDIVEPAPDVSMIESLKHWLLQAIFCEGLK
jgi:hypothetical protein